MAESLDLTKHTFTSTRFRSVIQAALRFIIGSPLHPLPPTDWFAGAGVYAIYYSGECEFYKHIVVPEQSEPSIPIYVGKAVPSGWRIGRSGRVGSNVSRLYQRLVEHARNIDQVTNLEVSDFQCRFMILGGIEADLISACEAQLIRRFTPLWNTVVDGFGNHTPGKGRFNQARSEWDVLHPGRPWAAKCLGTPPEHETIVAKIAIHRDE